VEAPALRIACPSCGHSRTFPADRAPELLPHHCPRCGTDLVVDGLLADAAPAPPVPVELPPLTPAPSDSPGLLALVPVPAPWEAVALALFAAVLAWSWSTRGFMAAALSGADLVFHEAGHPIFGLFGSRFLMFLGGTLAQLAFPVAAAVGFARTRRAGALGVALVWIGFNLVEIGTYAADASDRILPLLAVDEDSHDWWNMLGMLGVREHCRGIGGAIRGAGWLLWVGAPALAAWLAVRKWGARPPA
jgi:hypothetical protein